MSIEEIIKKIELEECFECTSQGKEFYIRIDRFVPWLATAIHDGGGFREELQKKTLKSDLQRWYEEDPYTGQMVSGAPIFLKGLDSRFEYDLNRSPDKAVYETAWGEKCWKEPLSEAEKERSLTKHKNYYLVLNALISKLELKFDKVLFVDMHSYNWKRHNKKVPEFNIGTKLIDTRKWENEISEWRHLLASIVIPDNENRTGINEVFEGRGYNLSQTSKRFKKTLVLATEISKIYCDELTGEIYHHIVDSVSQQLGEKMKKLYEEYFLPSTLTN